MKIEPLVRTRATPSGSVAVLGTFGYEVLSYRYRGGDPLSTVRECAGFGNWWAPKDRIFTVNVSPAAVLAHPEKLRGLREEFPRLRYELTEEELPDGTGLRELGEAMRIAGGSFLLDDFGTGAADPERLFALPCLCAVKLDRDFWADPSMGTELKRIIGYLKRTGVRAIGEKVESREEALYLLDAGVGIMQGWHFGGGKHASAAFPEAVPAEIF